MTPIYELVTAAELKVGDVVLQESGEPELLLTPSFFWEGIDEDQLYFRRIPVTEYPRVLRRIIDLMMKHMDNCNIENVSFDDWEIEAIRTLRSEDVS